MPLSTIKYKFNLTGQKPKSPKGVNQYSPTFDLIQAFFFFGLQQNMHQQLCNHFEKTVYSSSSSTWLSDSALICQ